MLVLTKNGDIVEKDEYVLESISSRGNGRYGLELNPYALSGVNTNYPQKIKTEDVAALFHNLPDKFEIRGEAVIPKNEKSYEKYGKDSVWRNIASGIFNRIVPSNIEGLIEYCEKELGIKFDWQRQNYTLDGIEYERKFFILSPEYCGRTCTNKNVLEAARLFTSLSPNDIKFKRGMYLIVYKNGSVKILDENDNQIDFFTCDEQLDFIIYSISNNGSNIDLNDIKDEKELDIFDKIGFKTIKNVDFEENEKENLESNEYQKTFKITSNREEIHKAVNEFYGINPETNKRDKEYPRLRNMYEYACDGIVVKPVGSNKYTQKTDLRLGRNNKIVSPEYPEDQIAIKLLSETVKVKLDHIEYNKTKIGNVTCSGILDKGYKTESGAVVSTVNLHNPEWLFEHPWIKEGEEYDLCMSLDIIPVLMNPNL